MVGFSPRTQPLSGCEAPMLLKDVAGLRLGGPQFIGNASAQHRIVGFSPRTQPLSGCEAPMLLKDVSGQECPGYV